MRTASEICRNVYKGKNFITPNIIEYIKLNDNSAIELSEGKGFTNNTLYGVSVVINNERSELSKCCDSYNEAINYINDIKKEYK